MDSGAGGELLPEEDAQLQVSDCISVVQLLSPVAESAASH